jgi:hypothetical protein
LNYATGGNPPNTGDYVKRQRRMAEELCEALGIAGINIAPVDMLDALGMTAIQLMATEGDVNVASLAYLEVMAEATERVQAGVERPGPARGH